MLSVRDIAGRVASGRSDAAAELRHCAEVIAARDGEIRAFVAVASDWSPGSGPLAGIACGVKDIIDTADLPTGMGSAIYAGWRPMADAALVVALRSAGATIAGKTATTAFAFSDPAATRNPRDLSATPGGSSSGSAAAVAAGMVPLAVGTQTGGSVVRPAAFCGIAGLKPSFGLLPMVGIKTFSRSLDTAGLMAASAGDLGFAMAAITGRPELDAAPAPAKDLRLGLFRQPFAGAADPAAEDALNRVAEAAAAAGATLVEMETPRAFTEAWAAHGALQDFEAFQALAWERTARAEALPPKLAAHLAAAAAVTPARYDEARRIARRGRAAAPAFFAGVDAVIGHSARGEAPAGLDSTGDPAFNRLWTLLGTPCLAIPVLTGPRGLPVGVQVIGPHGGDETVVAVARALEQALAGER